MGNEDRDTDAQDALQAEIEAGRQTIRTDQYSMSIGEIVSLYRDGEMVIRPEFQRLFRWKPHQKSRLIESILLGIPLPSVFLSQRKDGIWEVIDGLQRLSTIFEFMGELKTNDGEGLQPPSVLQATDYLPSLENVVYDDEFVIGTERPFTSSQRLSFKRAKLDLKILQPESDAAAKYELFDRLNAGGSAASAQEVRNAQLLLRDPTMSYWIDTLYENGHYQTTLNLSARLIDEGFDQELVYRYLSIRYTETEALVNIRSVDEFFSDRVFELAADTNFNRPEAHDKFARTFALLAEAQGEDTFRRWDDTAQKFKGAFSVSAFECISVGVSRNLAHWEGRASALSERINSFMDEPEFRAGSRSGTSASSRIPKTVPFAVNYFSL